MKRESPGQALTVVAAVVVVCATLVSVAVVLLRPLQLDNRLLERARTVLQLAGTADGTLGDAEVLRRFKALDARVVDLETGRFEPAMDAFALAARGEDAAFRQDRRIPDDADLAGLGERPRYAVVFLVWQGDTLQRIVLPVYGTGMWSTIRGYVALEGDLNTIAAVTFYEQAETPGVGDRITGRDWLRKWQGRHIYDADGVPQFAIAEGDVEPGSASALYNVDGISGATVTGDAVTAMIRFWFGPWGFRDLLQHLRTRPPAPPERGGTR